MAVGAANQLGLKAGQPDLLAATAGQPGLAAAAVGAAERGLKVGQPELPLQAAWGAGQLEQPDLPAATAAGAAELGLKAAQPLLAARAVGAVGLCVKAGQPHLAAMAVGPAAQLGKTAVLAARALLPGRNPAVKQGLLAHLRAVQWLHGLVWVGNLSCLLQRLCGHA